MAAIFMVGCIRVYGIEFDGNSIGRIGFFTTFTVAP